MYYHYVYTLSYQETYSYFLISESYLPNCLPILCNRITWHFSSFQEEMATKWKAKRKCMQCHYILRC